MVRDRVYAGRATRKTLARTAHVIIFVGLLGQFCADMKCVSHIVDACGRVGGGGVFCGTVRLWFTVVYGWVK